MTNFTNPYPHTWTRRIVTFFAIFLILLGITVTPAQAEKPIQTFAGPYGVVEAVAISPDGKFALLGTSESLNLWDITTGKKVINFEDGIGYRVALSPDGKYALSGERGFFGSEIKLWDVLSGEEVRAIKGHKSEVNSVIFSPDGKYVLSGSDDKTLKLWEVATGKEIRSFKGHKAGINLVAFSPNGKYALSGGGDEGIGELKLWEIATGREVRSFVGHKNAIMFVAFSYDGKHALSASETTIKVWEVVTGREVLSIKSKNFFITVAFSPDGRYALSEAEDRTLHLWDMKTGQLIYLYQLKNNEYLSNATFSPDSKTFLSFSNYVDKKEITSIGQLWKVKTDKRLLTFNGHKGPVLSVAFSPDGKYVLSASMDKTLKLWDVSTGKEIRSFPGHKFSVYSVAISPDGKYVLSGSNDKALKLWDLASGNEIREFDGHRAGVWSVAFSPDGKFALSGSSDQNMKLWEVATGKEVRSINCERIITSVAFSPDGRYALSECKLVIPDAIDRVTSQEALFLWDVTTGKEVRMFWVNSRVRSAAFSPNGIYAVSGSYDGNLSLWEVATGNEIRRFKGHEKKINSVKFSPDGRYVLSGSDDNTLKIWSVDLGVEIRTLTGHKGSVLSVSFSPDGKFALSGSHDKTLRLWKLDLPEAPRMSTASSDPGAALPAKAFGNYHALIIGINDYEHLKDLKTPVDDAKEVDRILREQYGFKTKLLINPGRSQIMKALNKLSKTLKPEDNLIIYYAGHGVYDKAAEKAYWQPADAEPDDDTNWIIVDRITSSIKRMATRHVLVVADSCYSGTLVRGQEPDRIKNKGSVHYLANMNKNASRTLMASGGNEPVADAGSKGHSVFARFFIDGLKNPGSKVFTAEDLFDDHIKITVAGSAKQIPEYKIIRDSGHEGGDFVFRKIK